MGATKKGRILLGCRRCGDKPRVEIWDTGLGVPEGQLRAIFQESHQIDNPARERSRGLAIVQRLGDLLGHTTDVHSRHDSGSVFAIEVALRPRAEPSRRHASNGICAPQQTDRDMRHFVQSLLAERT
jgi:two-component system, chemotaxis family, CheB/CheR fusion protein